VWYKPKFNINNKKRTFDSFQVILAAQIIYLF